MCVSVIVVTLHGTYKILTFSNIPAKLYTTWCNRYRCTVHLDIKVSVDQLMHLLCTCNFS